MSTKLTLLIMPVLSLLALDCNNDKKDNIYNHIDFDSINAGTLVKGEEIYINVCASCHRYGTAGAATMVDFRSWDKSANKGMDKVLDNVIEGYNGALGVMPPKGNCLSCSDEDIRASVLYIFKEVKDNKEKMTN
jgi:cytochrome c5